MEKKIKKMLLMIFILNLIILSVKISNALTLGDYGNRVTVSCKSSPNNVCWITETTYYDNMIWFTISYDGLKKIEPISGTDTTSFFFLPDSLNHNYGFGVIDGFMQYYPNLPYTDAYYFTSDSTLIYYNYYYWRNELVSRGIYPPETP